MTTSIIRAGGTGVPGVQTTGGDDGALALKVGPLAATVEALSITTAGSVGIGTAAPGTEGTNVRLAIVGTASQQASSLATSDTNAGFTVRGNSSSGYLLAIGATNNSSQPYIQAVNYNGGAASAALSIQPYGGNVGIGTTAPVNKLEIAGGLYVSGNASYSASGYGLNLYNLNDTKTIGLAYNRTTSLFMDVLLAAKQFEFETNGTERMRITSAGNVGIGTTAPGEKLTTYQAGDGLHIKATNNTQYSAMGVSAGASAGYFDVAAGSNMLFTDGGVENMRIDSSGNVMVGSTSTNPVSSRANGAAILAGGSIVSRAISGGSYFGLSVTSGVNLYFYTDNGSAFVTGGNISTNGATTAYNATSDYRLKNNIQPLTDALSRVALLRPVKWTWKEELGGTDPNGEGFVAHELAEILPMAVTGEKDAVDAEGKPQYQGVDTSFLVATLTAAIQEQQATIEALTTRITALEG